MLAAALALAACGKDDPSTTTTTTTGGTPAKKQPDPAAAAKKREAAAAARKQKIAALEKTRDDLRAKAKDLTAAVATLEARHAEEEKSAPDLSKLRRRFMQVSRDSNNEASRLRTMERQLDEVRASAEKAATGEIKALREKLNVLDKQHEKASDAFRKLAQEAELGVVDESPVKLELDTVRAVKQAWFKATPRARAGLAAGSEKAAISTKFRQWIGEKPLRGKVVTAVLTQSIAPKGLSASSYDFSNLDFFILLELLEADLDRKNVVEEKKGFEEDYKKVEAIELKQEALREKIAEAMAKGGGDLEVYDDLSRRVPPLRKKVAELNQLVQEYANLFGEADTATDRRDKEMDEAIKARDGAKKELAKAVRSLRSMGVR